MKSSQPIFIKKKTASGLKLVNNTKFRHKMINTVLNFALIEDKFAVSAIGLILIIIN